jgi:hypothetical protein
VTFLHRFKDYLWQNIDEILAIVKRLKKKI